MMMGMMVKMVEIEDGDDDGGEVVVVKMTTLIIY